MRLYEKICEFFHAKDKLAHKREHNFMKPLKK